MAQFDRKGWLDHVKREDEHSQASADGLDSADQIEWLRTPDEEEARRALLALRESILNALAPALAAVAEWLSRLAQGR